MSILWYNSPAANWNEALPLGNGFMGAMCFGGTRVDRYQLNDDTVWSGGPIDRINPDAKEGIEKVRALIREGRLQQAEELAEETIAATPQSERHYEPLCDLVFQLRADKNDRFDMPHGLAGLENTNMSGFERPDRVADYRRQLDLNSGIFSVSYTLDGLPFSREAFISYPHRVMVMTIDGGDCRIMLRRKNQLSAHIACDDRTVAITGSAGNGGVSFCCAMRAIGENVRRSGDMLRAEGKCTLLITSATSFREGGDLLKTALDRIAAAEKTGYESLRDAHIADFAPFMNSCSLSFDTEAPDLPHNERLARMQDGNPDYGLISDMFAMGRYLLVSSSRPGSLPANLQGIWNQSFTPPWDSKYTININTEMNYWPAEVCNLSDLHTPLFDHIRRMVPSGRECARRMYGADGWMAHHNTDIWGDCAPQDNYPPSTFWQMGAAWLTLHIWEHYLFTGDEAFLRESYPLIEEAARFFIKAITVDANGLLTVSPSLSPENTYRLPTGATGCLCDDAAMDQQILHELFTAVVSAAKILGEDASQYEKLLPELRPVVVSPDGRISEWMNGDKAEIELGHRHISHLFALYPGKLITSAKPEFMAAARKTLEFRLANGGGHTGWSRAWIIHFWARLLDGKLAGENVELLLSKSTLPNLFDNHPPFQIDGNFGLSSGVTEMLLQSHEGFLRLFPALPENWPDGSLTGAKARGGYTVDLTWKSGKPQRAVITAENEGTLRLANGYEHHHRAGDIITLYAPSFE